MFSGDLGVATGPMRLGWATGYALSIYGTNTPSSAFGNGNGYGVAAHVGI